MLAAGRAVAPCYNRAIFQRSALAGLTGTLQGDGPFQRFIVRYRDGSGAAADRQDAAARSQTRSDGLDSDAARREAEHLPMTVQAPSRAAALPAVTMTSSTPSTR